MSDLENRFITIGSDEKSYDKKTFAIYINAILGEPIEDLDPEDVQSEITGLSDDFFVLFLRDINLYHNIAPTIEQFTGSIEHPVGESDEYLIGLLFDEEGNEF